MLDLTPDEIALLMRLVDAGFRAVVQHAGINALTDTAPLKSALDKLQAAHDAAGDDTGIARPFVEPNKSEPHKPPP